MEAAFILGNRGEYLITLGRPAEALEPLRRALTGWAAQIGAEHQFGTRLEVDLKAA